MKKTITMTVATLLISAVAFASSLNHECVDDELFLNPYIDTELTNTSGQLILDVGRGLAPLSIKAEKKGAKIYAFESSSKKDQLPYDSNSFDQTFCVDGLKALVEDRFREFARVIKTEGRAMIVAPASHGILFTDGCQSEEIIRRQIQDCLVQIGHCEEETVITNALSQLNGVLRATFVRRQGILHLVTEETDLKAGESIWYKTPNRVIFTTYHFEEEYLAAIKQAGLFCEEIKRPCFFGGVKYRLWKNADSENHHLGEAYITNHPFTIFYVVKKA